MKERLRRALVLGWVLTVLGVTAVVVWYVLWGGRPGDRPNRAQVAGTLLAAVVIAPPAVAWAWVRWRQEPPGEAESGWGRVWVLSRYGNRYRRWVRDSNMFMDVKGLATVGDHTPRLDEVFVDVALVSRAPHAVSANPLAEIPENASERYSIKTFLNRKEPVVLAVVGPPGCGKTTLLAHVARRTARRGRRGLRVDRWGRRTVPVMLALRDHARVIADDPEIALSAVVRAAMRDRLPIGEPPRWWERQLMHGRCLVLLDGLDEVAREDDRNRVAGWIERQINRYPDNHFVITSRPQGYRSAVIAAANVVTIRPFTAEQVERFLRGWYLATERRATGANRREMRAVRQRAEERAGDLLGRLRSAPALGDLTANPLLLTMTANVHRYRGSLPDSRVDLYGEICQVMLSRRIQAKNLPEQLQWPAKEKLLTQLAFQMMTRRVRDLPRDRILEILAPLLARMPQQVSGQDFLDDVWSNGLMVEREHGQYAFAHLTFQEFLAACHIRDNALTAVLPAMVDDDWWRETTLLHVALADSDRIIEACLDSGSIPALALAFDCADIAHDLAPLLRERLDEVIELAFDDGCDPAHRRLVAAVLAARSARRTVTTASGSRVCIAPVTAALYWLFLQDANALPPDAACVPTSAGGPPAAGVWGGEALAFLAWVNSVTAESAQARFRLPSPQELDEQLVREALGRYRSTPVTTVWTQSSPDATAPAPWVLSEEGDPHLVAGSTVRRALVADLSETLCLLQLLATANYVLAVALARIRGRAHDLARTDELNRDRVAAVTRDRALADGLDLARDLDLEGELDLERVRARSREFSRVHGFQRFLDLAYDFVLVLVLTLLLVLMLSVGLGFVLSFGFFVVVVYIFGFVLVAILDPFFSFVETGVGGFVLGLIFSISSGVTLGLVSGSAIWSVPGFVGGFVTGFVVGRYLDRNADLNLIQYARDGVDHLVAPLRLRIRNLAQGLDRVLVRGQLLVRGLDRGVGRQPDPKRLRIRDLVSGRGLASLMAGTAGEPLGSALHEVLTATTDPADAERTIDRFVSTLMSSAGVSDSELIRVPLDGSMMMRLQAACAVRAGQSSSGSWRQAEVAERLVELARPLLERHETPTASTAARIRVASLALVSGADDPSQVFRMLAALVTLVHRRAAGEAPVGEALVLAIA